MRSPSSDMVIALSLSPPNDLARLGYLSREFEGLAFELALQIIRNGGRVLYGGHLQPGGMTLGMFEHLASAYASGTVTRNPAAPKPFISLLAGTELRKTPFDELADTLCSFQGFIEVRVILRDGRWRRAYVDSAPQASIHLSEVGGDTARLGGQAELDKFASTNVAMDDAAALTAMRVAATKLEAGRIVAGGRRGDLGVKPRFGEARLLDQFSGRIPGIYEEIIASLPSVPVAILAAWGGAAREAAFDLCLLDHNEARAPYLGDEQEGVALGREELKRAWESLSEKRRAEQQALAPFARRNDGPTLARDVVRELIRLGGFH